MGRFLDGRKLAEEVRGRGVRAVCHMLEEAYSSREIRTGDFSIRDLCEHLVPDGREYLQMMDPRRKGGYDDGVAFKEAASAVNTGDFTNITGQIVYSEIRRAFDDQILLAPQLCTEIDTPFLDGEKIPGIGRIGDVAEPIGEGNPYPKVGLNEEYVQTPPTEKRGFIVPVTREIVVADRTGILMERASEGAKWLAINKEKRVLSVVTATSTTYFPTPNNYKRNGTNTNTFLTSGAYINDQTGNALVDWSNIQKAELLFDAITDPNTAEPIMIPGLVVLVPTALKRVAYRILHATQIRFGDNTVSASTNNTYAPNPMSQKDEAGFRMNIPEFTILSSAYVKYITTSTSKWYAGDPKKAFRYMKNWSIETMEASAAHPDNFERDIIQQFRVSERGVPFVYEPRYWVRNDT